jgi:uracil permease
MGPVVALIGLELAGSAAQTGGLLDENMQMVENIDPKVLAVFLVTLLLAIFGGVLYRGFASAIAILIAITAGYVLSLVFGLVDFSAIGQAGVFELPAFQTPQWSVQAIAIIIPATLVVVSEHIGHQVVTSEVVGKDLLKDPGLHRTLLGDGVGSIAGAFFGGCPNTTYGESIGCVAITGNASVITILATAILAIAASFFGPFVTFLSTIPSCVMGGVCITLYGFIAVSGLKMLQPVDLNDNRNLFTASVILIAGIGGMQLGIGSVTLTKIACALILGIVVNLIFNRPKKEDK